MAGIEVLSILTLAGLTIILGYIGSLIFTKTRIPDVLWLMLFGMVVGPILGLVNVGIFRTMTPLLAVLALIIILFDGGLNMNFYQVLKGFSRSILLSALGVLAAMIAIGLLSIVLFRFDLMTGLLLGAIIGGTSSPIVISIVSRLKVKENVQMLLTLESILTDPLCVVIAIALLQIITLKTAPNIAQAVFSAFSIGALLGFVLGVVWLFALDKLKKNPFDYMITLAVLLLIYVFVESVGGSGAIAALIFGLVLGNSKIFSRILKLGKIFTIDNLMKKFHTEVSFFVRSFFFVCLGLIASTNLIFALYGAVIAAILIVIRIGVVKVATFGMTLSKTELNLIKIMTPRGLAAAVLAQLAFGIVGGETILNVTFFVIFITVIYTTICTRIFYNPEKA